MKIKHLFFLLVAKSNLVLASTQTSNLPFVAPLIKIENAITGPIAQSMSLLGIAGAGIALIFGGEIGQFTRSLIFIVLVVSIVVGAKNLMSALSMSGALIPGL